LKPIVPAKGKIDSSMFAFGGGLKNGGLSDEAMKLLREIFSFDYMGSAEFEWGAVPKALEGIWNLREQYTAFRKTIPYHYLSYEGRLSNPEHLRGKVEIGVICSKENSEEVVTRIEAWADDDYFKQGGRQLKEATLFPYACSGMNKGIYQHKGWLELDNGFFWFVDDGMFQKTAELFEISVES
jgi:hypothetical protein